MTRWTTESVYSDEALVTCSGDKSVYIAVRAEVPMEGDVRLPRRGNRYFPTFVDLEAYGELLSFSPDDARDFARKLLAAADAADAIDTPDADVCGHWWPCGSCAGPSTREEAEG